MSLIHAAEASSCVTYIWNLNLEIFQAGLPADTGANFSRLPGGEMRRPVPGEHVGDDLSSLALRGHGVPLRRIHQHHLVCHPYEPHLQLHVRRWVVVAANSCKLSLFCSKALHYQWLISCWLWQLLGCRRPRNRPTHRRPDWGCRHCGVGLSLSSASTLFCCASGFCTVIDWEAIQILAFLVAGLVACSSVLWVIWELGLCGLSL
jgi:hypothetical protein